MSNKPRSMRRKDRTDSITFPLDPNDWRVLRPVIEEHDAAKGALDELVGDTGREALQAKYDQAKAKLDEVLAEHPAVTFHLRALSAVKLQALQSDHPPKPEQIESVKTTDPDAPAPDFDPETYPPALLAAACTGVEWSDGTKADALSIEDATDFYSTSSYGDQQMILAAIGMLNELPSRVAALGKG